MPEMKKGNPGAGPAFNMGRGPMGPGARFHNKAEKLNNPKETLKRMVKYLEANHRLLVFIFALCIITALISIFGTRLNGYAVDEFIATGNMRGLAIICGILAGIYLIGVVSTFFQNRFMIRIAQEV